MNHADMKAARKALGLTIDQMAKMLDTDRRSLRRIETDPMRGSGQHTSRDPAPRMVRLMQAYLEGHRPKDWPTHGKENENDI